MNGDDGFEYVPQPKPKPRRPITLQQAEQVERQKKFEVDKKNYTPFRYSEPFSKFMNSRRPPFGPAAPSPAELDPYDEWKIPYEHIPNFGRWALGYEKEYPWDREDFVRLWMGKRAVERSEEMKKRRVDALQSRIEGENLLFHQQPYLAWLQQQPYAI